MHQRARIPSVSFVVGLLCLGCSGTVDRPGGEDDRPGDGTTMRPGDPPKGGTGANPIGPGGSTGVVKPPAKPVDMAPARIRRLTSTEIKNTIRDVLVPGAPFEASFPTEEALRSFDNQYEELSVGDEFAAALQSAAEKAAELATRNLPALHACDPVAKGEPACAQDFVDVFGLRLFRKPLTDGQKQRLVAVYTEARKGGDHKTGIATVIESMLQSPAFLFRSEYGGGPVAGKKVVALTPYETASAMSYYLWASAPDPQLLDAAKAGKLATKAEIAAQARRMLQDARAKETIRRFFVQWLELKDETLSKTDKAFSAAVAKGMTGEVTRFLDQILWSGDAAWKTMVTSTATFANADVAKLYGITGPKGAAHEPVMVDAETRSGFLTQPGFIAAHTAPAGGNPIFMGHFVRTKIFCQGLPPPPPGIPPAPENVQLSTRQKYAQHRNDAQCAGCHTLIDPIGFGFERYDPMGRYQTVEGTAPLTGEGELVQTDVDGKFVGAVELAQRIAKSAAARECFAGQVLKYLLGRDAAEEARRLAVDRESLRALGEGAFKGGDVKELLVAALTTDAFLFRDAGALPGGAP